MPSSTSSDLFEWFEINSEAYRYEQFDIDLQALDELDEQFFEAERRELLEDLVEAVSQDWTMRQGMDALRHKTEAIGTSFLFAVVAFALVYRWAPYATIAILSPGTLKLTLGTEIVILLSTIRLQLLIPKHVRRISSLMVLFAGINAFCMFDRLLF